MKQLFEKLSGIIRPIPWNIRQNPALSGAAELSGSGRIAHFAIRHYPVSGYPADFTIRATLK